MTVTEKAVAQALTLLRDACGGLRDATPSTWAAILNAAPLTVTDAKGQRTPVRGETGQGIPLNPGDDEVLPAALTIASLGMHFIQAADLAATIQANREGDRATRNARIRKDAQRHGALIPDGLGDDVPAELAWRKAATSAIGAGATRTQAEAHAWRTIGQQPPQVTGRDRSGDVRRLLAG